MSAQTTSLLSMDANCLAFLVAMGGRDPYIAIPAKLFKGDIPEGHPNLLDQGFIEHHGDDVLLTDAGRSAVNAARSPL